MKLLHTMVIAVSAFAGGCVAHELAHVSPAYAQQTPAAAPAAPTNAPQWEQRLVKSYAFSDAELTALGKQGWEIVSCPAVNACFMKRPL